MAKLYTITETILSTGAADVEAVIASSLQTWTYANEEHSQLAFTSISDELIVAYPQGRDGDFLITHEQTPQQLTITISTADSVYETIVLAYHIHDTATSMNWWQTLATTLHAAVTTQFGADQAPLFVTKSLVSGFSPKDDDGLATSLQTWTYAQAADATNDFTFLTTELRDDYPLGVHEDGFEVVRADLTANQATVEVTQDGELYEVITITNQPLTAAITETWWQAHEQHYRAKCQ